ncbi:MAG: aldehyde dehydrogenase [Candidatus Omnitrophica bacterium CG11_big_fil_rev_8_21_14_0_20_42_13]|uniref:Aldehyde dehydrogenase n=1 Tax=Candidatus Ghiorseimicrobium undicola TaxID=1974746 RepID=A0A2H0LXU9_9BACT|nr:MAG: aldehyde dehydrogenase [Candidatus Omnitrophica bacterium CG11_big_fil_rev_8_21_14_0_20_42_13]
MYNKKNIASINPSTGEIITQFPALSARETEEAIKAARGAFDNGDWPKMPLIERAPYLQKIAQIIREKADELAKLESQDTGKTIKQTTFIDIPTAASAFEYFAAAATEIKGETIPTHNPALSFTLREPMGVVGQIIPWNYPFLMAAWKIAPAIILGNSVVFKPSQLASLTCLELARIIEESGLPKGVVNIVTGTANEVGKTICENKLVDMISFTGGNTAGKEIMQLAASNTKKISLELGGKSPNIVFADCDIEAAVGGSMSAIFMNQGQMCTAGSRLILEDKIYDKFIDLLVAKTKKLKIGDALSYDTDFGPIISAEHRQYILDYIETGKKEAKLTCGGVTPNVDRVGLHGFYLEPAIFIDVDNNARISQEEIFGPVLSIIKFSGQDEAVKIANDTRFGLASMVWTKDLNRANQVAAQLRCGTVWINTYGGFYNEAPFGGYKESGFGRELGKEGLLEYTQTKHVNIDLNPTGRSLVTSWFA